MPFLFGVAIYPGFGELIPGLTRASEFLEMTDYDSYVICTAPRSGSTLLCRLLTATGVAGNPDSHFHDPALNSWLVDYDLGHRDYADKRTALAAVMEAAIRRGTAGTGIFGLRLQEKSRVYFLQQLEHLHPSLSSDEARLSATFGRTLFIHLTRADKLAQAISFVKARQTGLWHKHADGRELERLSPPAEPVYDPDEIARCITEFEAMDAAWQSWFTREAIQPLAVTYDQLSVNPLGVLSAVLRALGVDSATTSDVPVPTAKLSDDTNRDWARRFLADRAREAPGHVTGA